MKLDAFCERYCLDARSFEEKNARSLALGKERLAAGKTGQAMRLFAYNHALNQNRPKTSAQAGLGTKWKVRVWKNNKVVKTMTVEKGDEAFINSKVKGLGIDWDKATVHDPKTMKQQKSYKNANAGKSALKAPVTATAKTPVAQKTSQPPKQKTAMQALEKELKKIYNDAEKKGKSYASTYSPKIQGLKRPDSILTGKDNGIYHEFMKKLDDVFNHADSNLANTGYRFYRDIKGDERTKMHELSEKYRTSLSKLYHEIYGPIYRKADLLF